MYQKYVTKQNRKCQKYSLCAGNSIIVTCFYIQMKTEAHN